MRKRFLIMIWFIILSLLLIHRQGSQQMPAILKQPLTPLHEYDQTSKKGYKLGIFNTQLIQHPTVIGLSRYKKINSFIFVHYNKYKTEISFIDLGYSSVVYFSIFGQQINLNIQERIGFSLPINKFDGLNMKFQKPYFNLTVQQNYNKFKQQTTTYFKISFIRNNQKLQAYLKHIYNNNQCFTAFRENKAISHKCYGGKGEGDIKIQNLMLNIKKKNVTNYHFAQQLTRCVFDGFRAQGMHWKWLWAMASGFSKDQFIKNNYSISNQQFIGLNFGFLNGQSQDFIFFNKKIFFIRNISYQIHTDLKNNKTIKFSSQSNPKFKFRFNIINKVIKKKDLYILKVDTVKAEGYWNGWIEIDQKKHHYSNIVGMIEIGNCIF